MKTAILIGASLVLVANGYAEEENPFGTAEQAVVCQKHIEATHGNWRDKEASNFSAECQAEVKRRLDLCLPDPAIKKITDDAKYRAHEDPVGYCHEVLWGRMQNQLDKYKEVQERAKQAADAQAKLEATEVPKADQKNPKLEKAVADAYHRDYPEGKVLQVVLGNWSDDYEKDAFGRVNGRDLDATVVNQQPDGKCQLHNEYWLQHGNGRSFSGPLSARGAGSMNVKEILCSKLGSTVASSGGGGKKRK